jgi:hypothetical protein
MGSRLRREGSDGKDPRLTLAVSEPTVELGSGAQTLGLRNELSRPVTVRIERTATRDDALTAARAWAMPKFRELFPGETLESGRLVAVGQLSFLILRVIDHLALIERQGDAAALAETVKAFDRLQTAAERHHGRLTSSSMDLAIASFERPGDALEACLSLWKTLEAAGDALPTSLALHRGPAVATSIDDRMAYYGRTLARALELVHELSPHQLVLSSTALGDDVTPLTRAGLTTAIVPAPRLGPAAWCVKVER